MSRKSTAAGRRTIHIAYNLLVAAIATCVFTVVIVIAGCGPFQNTDNYEKTAGDEIVNDVRYCVLNYDVGTIGPISSGTTRDDLIKILGEPDIPETAPEDIGFLGEYNHDFWDEIGAEVNWNACPPYGVLQVNFKWKDFERYTKSYKLVLFNAKGGLCILSSKTRLEDFEDEDWVLRNGLSEVDLQIRKSDLTMRFVTGDVFHLGFDKETHLLEYAWYIYDYKNNR